MAKHTPVTRPLLGAILEQKFGLAEAKLLEALNIQQTKGGRLGEALLKIRAIEEDLLLQALAIQFDMPWLPHLDVAQVDHQWIKKVPIHFARRYRVLPLKVDEGVIVVATTDPLETAALDDLRLLLGMPVKAVLTSAMSLMSCLNRAYDEAASPTGAEQVMLYTAGVQLYLGTDVQQPFTVPGISLHQEMRLFARSGIPSEAIWKMATLDAGRSLGLAGLGNLISGAPADFLIFRRDPTGDLANLDALEAVVTRGRLFTKAAIDAKIAEYRAHYDGLIFDTLSIQLAKAALRKVSADPH